MLKSSSLVLLPQTEDWWHILAVLDKLHFVSFFYSVISQQLPRCALYGKVNIDSSDCELNRTKAICKSNLPLLMKIIRRMTASPKAFIFFSCTRVGLCNYYLD